MNRPAGIPYVGLARRSAAVLLDLALLSFLLSFIGWLLMLGDPDADAAMRSVSAVLVPSSVPLIALLWWCCGGTPGKMLLGCRFVDARSGGRPRLWQVMVRLLGYAVSALPLGAGFFWVLWDRRRQGWHDKLARTCVVEDDDSTLSLAQLAGEAR